MYSHIFVTNVINNKVEICEFAVTDGQMGRSSSLHSSLTVLQGLSCLLDTVMPDFAGLCKRCCLLRGTWGSGVAILTINYNHMWHSCSQSHCGLSLGQRVVHLVLLYSFSACHSCWGLTRLTLDIPGHPPCCLDGWQRCRNSLICPSLNKAVKHVSLSAASHISRVYLTLCKPAHCQGHSATVDLYPYLQFSFPTLLPCYYYLLFKQDAQTCNFFVFNAFGCLQRKGGHW